MILVSGGFDPLHDGHIDYLEEAAELDRVIVALNSDEWLIRKKGYRLLPWLTRYRILSRMDIVLDVIPFDDSDDTVCDALIKVNPDYFANGGDRKKANPLENKVCDELGVIQLFGIGGEKTMSSSDLVRKACDHCKSAL